MFENCIFLLVKLHRPDNRQSDENKPADTRTKHSLMKVEVANWRDGESV